MVTLENINQEENQEENEEETPEQNQTEETEEMPPEETESRPKAEDLLETEEAAPAEVVLGLRPDERVKKRGRPRAAPKEKPQPKKRGRPPSRKEPPAPPPPSTPDLPVRTMAPEWDLHAYNQHMIQALIQHSETSKAAKRNHWSGLVTF